MEGIPAALYALCTAGTSPNSPVNWFFTLFASPENAFTAPINMLLEMLSKCPRYFNHGPAIEI